MAPKKPAIGIPTPENQQLARRLMILWMFVTTNHTLLTDNVLGSQQDGIADALGLDVSVVNSFIAYASNKNNIDRFVNIGNDFGTLADSSGYGDPNCPTGPLPTIVDTITHLADAIL